MSGKEQTRGRREKTKEPEKSSEEKKALRPGQCRRYLRKTLADQFEEIVKGFVKQARNGGCAHMKLTAELLEDKKEKQVRRKGSAQRLLEELGE